MKKERQRGGEGEGGAIEKSAGREGGGGGEGRREREKESSQYVLQFIWSFIRGSETERGRRGSRTKAIKGFSGEEMCGQNQ